MTAAPKIGRDFRPIFLSILLTGTFLSTGTYAQTIEKKDKTSEQEQATSTPDNGDTVLLGTITVQGAVGSETDGYQPVTNSSATLTNMPILDIPQAVNVVSDQVIVDQDLKTLDDVLNNVSGITQTNTLAGTQDAFIRRGFGNNRDGSILTDGLRTVLPKSFTATTDRVEVLKGPTSALYGIQEPGGIINVITKKPQQTFGGSVSASASSFGGGGAEFDVTGPIAGTNFAYRLVGSYEDIDSWRNYGNSKLWQVAPSVAWYGEDTTINLSYTHRDYAVPFDRGTIFDLTTGKAVTTDPEIQFTEEYTKTKGQSDLVSLNIEHDISDNWQARFAYNFSQDVYSDNQARIISYDPATGDLERRADSTDGSTQKQHSARADILGDIDIAGYQNEVLLGVNYSDYNLLRTDMLRCSTVQDFNIYNPVYGTLPECDTVVASASDQTIQQKSVTGYAQDAFHLNDQWIMIGGLSFQHYSQYAGRGRPFKVNTDAEGSQLTPRGGLVFKATPTWSLYGNVATSYKPQSSIAKYIGALDPETGISYEVGTKFELFNGLTATAALYNIDKENVLYNETIAGVNYARTAGRVRSRGFEFDVAGSLTENLSLIASYGYTDAAILEDVDYSGKTPANVARHTGSLYLAYDFGEVWGENTLKVGGGIRGRSKRPGVNSNAYYLPGYIVADAFASYTVQTEKPVTFQLNLKNLFDQTYYTSSIASNNLGNAIGEPFQATLGVSMNF
ncbi:TonB-dependent siderophore receptor [Roseibium sp.]|uniref:TonB-dependent siderophore receptor n=1 Tax=Roseibium sp. TaxID=1936156 RepID=UPI003A97E7C9